MMSYSEAVRIVDEHRWQGDSQQLLLRDAIGKRLSSRVLAPFPLPRFRNSAMDGYALGSINGPWRVVGSIPAGALPTPLRAGEAAQVFTGAAVPNGAVAVIAQEDCSERAGVLSGGAKMGSHIRDSGEEFAEGDEALGKGTFVTPAVASTLASFGLETVEVQRPPRVGLVTTGSELVSSGGDLGPFAIFDSNSVAIGAALTEVGVQYEFGRSVDRMDALLGECESLLDCADVLITVGGVSVGRHDLVPEAVCELGFRPLFRGVAIKPGKPISLGLRGDGKYWFGLPGNPTSALITYALFVARFLGLHHQEVLHPVEVSVPRSMDRDLFIPASVNATDIELLNSVGSHSVAALVGATHLIHIAPDRVEQPASGLFPLIALPWRTF